MNLPKPPYISVQISTNIFCTLTGPVNAVRLFADYLLNQGHSLYYSLEAAKTEGAKISYTTHHPYHFPEKSRPVDLPEKQIEMLIRKRSTLSQMLDRKIWLGAFEGDCNLTEVEPKLGLLNHSINEGVWRELPPVGFPEFEKTEVFEMYRGFRRLKIIPAKVIRKEEMKAFFESLQNFLKKAIIFAVVAESGTMFYEFIHHFEDREFLAEKLEYYFPDFAVLESEEIDTAEFNSDICEISCSFVFLSRDDAKDSVRTSFQTEPYRAITNVLDEVLEAGQFARYEVLCRPYHPNAIRSVIQYLEAMYPENARQQFSQMDKEYIYRGARETVRVVRARNPIWSVNVRLFAAGKYPEEAERYLSKLFKNLNQFEKEEKPWIGTDLRESFEASLDELIALAHFPTAEIESEYLEVSEMKNKLPPELYTTGENHIGRSEARGQTKNVCLPEEVRARHVYLVGKSGTGKSTLLETIARNDIFGGKGLAIIDPHGDVIDHLLKSIPPERVDDVIYFNPRICPISLDIFNAVAEHEIDLLADDLITMFRRTSESWGDKMQAILQMSIQTLLRVKGTSFTDITRLLTDPAFRQRILSKIDHPQLENFWEHRFDSRQAEPILIRMDRLTTSGALRHILTQDKNSLNFYDVIAEGKIFLADLGKGFLGESTSHLIGSMIVSQIQLAAQRQMQLPEEQRIPFSLFVDEVQNFTTDAFGTILSEARKQKLKLCLAHQFVSQLPQEMQKAVFGNVGTLIFFALSPDDLGAARYELGNFEVRDVANLPKYHALCRPVTAAQDTFTFAPNPPPSPPLTEIDYTEEIIQKMKNEFGVFDSIKDDSVEANELRNESISGQFETNSAGQVSAEKAKETAPHFPRPMKSKPPEFYTNAEKIMFYIRPAEYLSQPQIIALTGLQPSNASTALKKLVRSGQIRNLDNRRPKIYFLGNSCRPTTHNLLIRNLFVKIHASEFAISKVDFNKKLSGLNPDLTIEFVSENKEIFPVYFEIDRGTEGVQELVSKAKRYSLLAESSQVGFIFEREQDLELAINTIDHPFISFATLDSFTSLHDSKFYSSFTEEDQGKSIPHPFFTFLHNL